MFMQSLAEAETLGCRYNDESAAQENTTKIQQWLQKLADNGKTAGLAITGPSTDTGREAGSLFVDCSQGPAITNPTGSPSLGFVVAGFPGSTLTAVNSAKPWTPVIEFTREGSASAILVIESLRVLSTDGSGIKLEKPGASTVLRNLFVQANGSYLQAPNEGVMRLDDFEDIDFEANGIDDPSVKCSYGVWVNNADGGMIENVEMVGCANHGLVATRWHAAYVQVRVHSSGGVGFKGERVNGCNIDIRSESNFAWAMFLERCGIPGDSGLLTVKGVSTPGNQFHTWFENNNMRVKPFVSRGFRNRQFKLRETSRCRVFGNSGWSKNMVDVRNSERASNEFVDQVFQPPTVAPVLDLQSASHIGRTNFDSAWSNEADRATLDLHGKEVHITIKQDSYRKARHTAWWQPFGDTKFSAKEGDLIEWTAELSINANGAEYAQSREPVEGSPNYPAWLGTINISQHHSSLDGINQLNGETYICLWDTERRRISNFLYRQAGTQEQNNNSVLMSLFFKPMDQGPGTDLPAKDFVMTVHDFKVYVVPR